MKEKKARFWLKIWLTIHLHIVIAVEADGGVVVGIKITLIMIE